MEQEAAHCCVNLQVLLSTLKALFPSVEPENRSKTKNRNYKKSLSLCLLFHYSCKAVKLTVAKAKQEDEERFLLWKLVFQFSELFPALQNIQDKLLSPTCYIACEVRLCSDIKTLILRKFQYLEDIDLKCDCKHCTVRVKQM